MNHRSKESGVDTYDTVVLDDLLVDEVHIINVATKEVDRQLFSLQIRLHLVQSFGHVIHTPRNGDNTRSPLLQKAFYDLIACGRNTVSNMTTVSASFKLPIPYPRLCSKAIQFLQSTFCSVYQRC